MKNSTKLEKLKKYLDENNVSYKCRRKHRNGHCDLYVIAAKVSVRLKAMMTRFSTVDTNVAITRYLSAKVTHQNLLSRKCITRYTIQW